MQPEQPAHEWHHRSTIPRKGKKYDKIDEGRLSVRAGDRAAVERRGACAGRAERRAGSRSAADRDHRHRHAHPAQRLSGADAAHRDQRGGHGGERARQRRRLCQRDPVAGRQRDAGQFQPQHLGRHRRRQRAQPARARHCAHAGAAGRPALGGIDRRRPGRRQHLSAGPDQERRDRHRRRLRRLWLGRGVGRGELHPRQGIFRPQGHGRIWHLDLWRCAQLPCDADRRHRLRGWAGT